MRYRVMRLMVMFDLPVITSEDRRNYRQFRKLLINEGFLMIQESVYVRVAVNKQSADFLEQRLAKMRHQQVLYKQLLLQKSNIQQ